MTRKGSGTMIQSTRAPHTDQRDWSKKQPIPKPPSPPRPPASVKAPQPQRPKDET